jgi:hypothetical protein
MVGFKGTVSSQKEAFLAGHERTEIALPGGRSRHPLRSGSGTGHAGTRHGGTARGTAIARCAGVAAPAAVAAVIAAGVGRAIATTVATFRTASTSVAMAAFSSTAIAAAATPSGFCLRDNESYDREGQGESSDDAHYEPSRKMDKMGEFNGGVSE